MPTSDTEEMPRCTGKMVPTRVSGKERIDLARACEILAAEFSVERMAVICVPELGVF